MANLVLIGNGFDVAHNLKTRYIDFISDVIACNIEKIDRYPGLIEMDNPIVRSVDKFFEYNSMSNMNLGAVYPNKFFRELISNQGLDNWSDIEFQYYIFLMETIDPDKMRKMSKDWEVYDINKLNDDFDVIKNYFYKYLRLVTNNNHTYDSFKLFFDKLSRGRSLVINFNYTKTVHYYQKYSKFELLDLHGQLDEESSERPIIFGFSTNENDSINLLRNGNNRHFQNNKDELYALNNDYLKLNDFLQKNKIINVLTFGHSMGMSDGGLLKNIVQHENVKGIYFFHYNTPENYSALKLNLQRILDGSSYKNKIRNFDARRKIPQFNDDNIIINEFKYYLDELFNSLPSEMQWTEPGVY